MPPGSQAGFRLSENYDFRRFDSPFPASELGFRGSLIPHFRFQRAVVPGGHTFLTSGPGKRAALAPEAGLCPRPAAGVEAPRE